MRLILFDRSSDKRINFYPLALGRPIFELRCGMTSLGEKLTAKLRAADVAYFVPPYMADVCRAKTDRPVNDPAALEGDDLLLLNGRVKAAELAVAATGPSQVAVEPGGEVLYARIASGDLAKLGERLQSKIDPLAALLDSAQKVLPAADALPAAWNYTWDLVLANPGALAIDFVAAGRHGIEGTIEEPCAIRGSPRDVYVAPARSSIRWRSSTPSTGRSISMKASRCIPSRGSRGPVTSASTRSSWAANAAAETPSAPCAASAARSKARSSMATRTSITTAFSATLTSASG